MHNGFKSKTKNCLQVLPGLVVKPQDTYCSSGWLELLRALMCEALSSYCLSLCSWLAWNGWNVFWLCVSVEGTAEKCGFSRPQWLYNMYQPFPAAGAAVAEASTLNTHFMCRLCRPSAHMDSAFDRGQSHSEFFKQFVPKYGEFFCLLSFLDRWD